MATATKEKKSKKSKGTQVADVSNDVGNAPQGPIVMEEAMPAETPADFNPSGEPVGEASPTTTKSEAEVHERRYPMTREAFEWMKKNVLGLDHNPFNYLSERTVILVAEALDRPVTLEELKQMIEVDGPKVVCSATGKEFQPVRWVHPRRSDYEDLAQSVPFAEVIGKIPWTGCFFPKGESLLAFSGSPFLRDRNTGASFINKNSAIGQAFFENEKRWGVELKYAEHLTTVARERRERREELAEGVQNAFRNRVGRDASIQTQLQKRSR